MHLMQSMLTYISVGRRRNLPIAAIASFVALSVVGSLGLSLNLFFVTMLFTPLAVHDDQSHRHDALFAPYAYVFYVPVIGAFVLEQSLPYLLARRTDLTLFRIAYLAIPLFLAFIPEVSSVPPLVATKHTDRNSWPPRAGDVAIVPKRTLIVPMLRLSIFWA